MLRNPMRMIDPHTITVEYLEIKSKFNTIAIYVTSAEIQIFKAILGKMA